MKSLFQIGTIIFVKSYTLCRIVFQTIIVLLFICWCKTRDKVSSWSYDCLGMSRQMGSAGSHLCPPQNEEEEKGNQRVINLLIDQKCQLEDERDQLQQQVKSLQGQIERQDEMISKQLGKDIELRTKGKCNNASEMVQPTSLSDRSKEICDAEWRDVMINMFKGDKEIVGIRFLSKIIVECQSFCHYKADQQLVMFVNPCANEKDSGCKIEQVIQSQEDLHNLYKIRRTIGLHESNKDAVFQSFWNEYKEREDFRKVTKEIKDDDEKMKTLRAYINSCCDLCWQSAISDPPLFLKFDVIGKHIDEVSDKFKTYHIPSVVDECGISNTVMQVVWPALVMKAEDGNTEFLVGKEKGTVIVFNSSAV